MCGRTACALAPDQILQQCKYKDKNGCYQKPSWKDPPGGQKYYPSYNVAPGSHTPVILCNRCSQGECKDQCDRVIQPMLWGLVPSWHKGDPKKVSYETNNCRAEGMLEKRTYKVPLEKGQRCVIIAEGFYEWKRDKSTKQPYFIYAPSSAKLSKEQLTSNVKVECKGDDSDMGKNSIGECSIGRDLTNTVHCEIKKEIKEEPCDFDEIKECKFEDEYNKEQNENSKGGETIHPLLYMAGVYDVWKSPEGQELFSYSVITVSSSKAMDWIHHRMPAILNTEEEINDWLDVGNVPLTKAVKCIRPTECIQHHPVSTEVNNSRNNSPNCVKEIDLRKPTPKNELMQKWLCKGKETGSCTGQVLSPRKCSEEQSPPKKKQKTQQNMMMAWLSKKKPDI